MELSLQRLSICISQDMQTFLKRSAAMLQKLGGGPTSGSLRMCPKLPEAN